MSEAIGAQLSAPHRSFVMRGGAARLERVEAHILTVVNVELAAVVLTQKVAFPISGPESQISLAFLIHFGVIAYFAWRGLLQISGRRLILFCAFVFVAALGQIQFVSQNWSMPSMMLMLATSSMFIFVVPLSRRGYREVLNRFVLVAAVAALTVGLDWGFQAVGLSMPNLETLIPKPMIYWTYNYIQPVEWGSPWNKPNGIFFLETSHVAQFIGIGLMIEAAFFRRIPMLLLLGAGLLSTLGVTGMLLVAMSVPFLLARLRPGLVVGVVLLTTLVALGTYQAGFLDVLLRRTDEFSQDSSSGKNRFVLPLEWSLATIEGPPERALFGIGAGAMPKDLNNDEAGTVGTTWPPYTKVGVEYGTVALIVWLFFIGTSLFGGGAPAIVAWVAFVQYNFLNGSLNVPIHTIYCVILCAGYLFGPQGSGSRATTSSKNEGIALV